MPLAKVGKSMIDLANVILVQGLDDGGARVHVSRPGGSHFEILLDPEDGKALLEALEQRQRKQRGGA